jgi:hypothetical protein
LLTSIVMQQWACDTKDMQGDEGMRLREHDKDSRQDYENTGFALLLYKIPLLLNTAFSSFLFTLAAFIATPTSSCLATASKMANIHILTPKITLYRSH